LVEKEFGRGPQNQNKEITKSDPLFPACMRKLLTILNAMVKNNTPWRAPQAEKA
jgi:hypothetical protein